MPHTGDIKISQCVQTKTKRKPPTQLIIISVICHVSLKMCHMSHVMRHFTCVVCHMSHVTCPLSPVSNDSALIWTLCK